MVISFPNRILKEFEVLLKEVQRNAANSGVSGGTQKISNELRCRFAESFDASVIKSNPSVEYAEGRRVLSG